MTQPGTRAQRLAMPLARDVVRELAITHGGCVRPSSYAAPTWTPARPNPCSSPAGTPSPRSAPPAPNGPSPCGRRSAAKAGTSTTSPSSRPTTPDDEQRMWVELRSHAQRAAGPGRRGRAGHAPRTTRRSGTWTSRSPGPGCAATCSPPAGPPSPLDPAPPGHPGPAPAEDHPADHRQNLQGPGREDVPAVDVHHPHLPELRARGQRRHPGRPGPLRLPAGGTGRAALRGAVRPVHPEPSPVPRPRRPVLRRGRTAAAAGPAHPHRHARHPVPCRAAPGARRHLPPGVVAGHVGRPLRRRRAAGLARGQRQLPRPRDRGSPADLGRGARRDRRRRTSRSTWPGSANGSTPRACWPGRGTPTGASATSPST